MNMIKKLVFVAISVVSTGCAVVPVNGYIVTPANYPVIESPGYINPATPAANPATVINTTTSNQETATGSTSSTTTVIK